MLKKTEAIAVFSDGTALLKTTELMYKYTAVKK